MDFSVLSWAWIAYCLYSNLLLQFCYIETILTTTTNTIIVSKEYCLSQFLESCPSKSIQFCSRGDKGLPAKVALHFRREFKHSRKRIGYRLLLREIKHKNFPPAPTSSHDHFCMKEEVHTGHVVIHYSKMLFSTHKIWAFSYKSTSFPCITTHELAFVSLFIKLEVLNVITWTSAGSEAYRIQGCYFPTPLWQTPQSCAIYRLPDWG